MVGKPQAHRNECARGCCSGLVGRQDDADLAFIVNRVALVLEADVLDQLGTGLGTVIGLGDGPRLVSPRMPLVSATSTSPSQCPTE